MTDKTSTITLDLQGLKKTFSSDLLEKSQVVIDNLSCSFPEGKCTGLLGHNGAGKTTTIRMILGLIRPDEGKILFYGSPITTADKAEIGYMPEIKKLPNALTPREVLKGHLNLFKKPRNPKQIIEEKLEQVGLANHQNKKIQHLSKGMARRLAWAQATIHNPKMLIVDEPFSGLDPLGRRQMQSWIEEQKKHGTTILLCTHELWTVQALCDDIHILNKGKLVLTSIDREGTAPSQDVVVTPKTTFDGRHQYNIHISGTDEPTLRQLGEDSHLLPWQHYNQSGFLSILGFTDYISAAAWLATCLENGIVVTRFGDETFIEEEELLPYFKGDSKC